MIDILLIIIFLCLFCLIGLHFMKKNIGVRPFIRKIGKLMKIRGYHVGNNIVINGLEDIEIILMNYSGCILSKSGDICLNDSELNYLHSIIDDDIKKRKQQEKKKLQIEEDKVIEKMNEMIKNSLK